MKPLRIACLAVAATIGLSAASVASAHPPRARTHIGLHVGIPLFWPWWGPYPYYAGPPYQERIVVVPSEPSVYVQRPDAATTPESGYWYYCASAGAYYPYVQVCGEGWQRVAPRPRDE